MFNASLEYVRVAGSEFVSHYANGDWYIQVYSWLYRHGRPICRESIFEAASLLGFCEDVG